MPHTNLPLCLFSSSVLQLSTGRNWGSVLGKEQFGNLRKPLYFVGD